MTEAIEVRGLRKAFGAVTAVEDVDLTVRAGTVLGLLGPNGAGKTTTVRMLATLLRPDAGTISVQGVDAVAEPHRVRPLIGLTGQYAAVDEKLTGAENLTMIGRLFRMPRAEARSRAERMLATFDLEDAGSRLVKGYSGGMRRRLDLAASLMCDPSVVFLDEPTAGLDPASRIALWKSVSGLVAAGTTVLLTTQYLEEADHLADDVVVIDHGRKIAEGTPSELKAKVGGERLVITVSDPATVGDAATALAGVVAGELEIDRDAGRVAGVVSTGAVGLMPDVVRRLDEAGVVVDDLGVHRPTLDDVFLGLTGSRRTGPHGTDTTDCDSDDADRPAPVDSTSAGDTTTTDTSGSDERVGLTKAST